MRIPTPGPSWRGTFTALVLSTGLISATFSPAPSGAAGCPSGWTAVGTGECELVVTASGNVTIPSEFTKFDVLVVGGGGGGGGGMLGLSVYGDAGGGGGGEYTVCKAVALSGTVSVTVGDGGTGGSRGNDEISPATVSTDGGDGGASSIGTCTAEGGKGGSRGSTAVTDYGTSEFGRGGASGNGNEGGLGGWASAGSNTYYLTAGGGGAGSGNSTESNGNGGYAGAGGFGGRGGTPKDGCFASNTQPYSGGGGGAGSYNSGGAFDGGGRGATASGGMTSVPAVAGTANTGGGGGGGDASRAPAGAGHYSTDGAAGGSGVVILRASTGSAPTITEISPTRGATAGGTTLTVKGTGFSCMPSISLGSAECADITLVSSTELTCTTPAGTGTASVIAETITGASTNSVSFEYSDSTPTTTTTVTSSGGAADSTDGDSEATGTTAEESDEELPDAGISLVGTMMAFGLALTAGVVAHTSGRRRRTRTIGW